MTAPVYIRCHALEKSFGAKSVLRGLSLDVFAGETLVVLGGSGSGKSVLLKHMNALIRPDAGEVEVGGAALGRLDEEALVPVRRNVAMLFQQGALFDSLTVGENVAYPLREHRVLPPDAIPARVRELLAVVDLPGTERLMPAELSGGMRKRAALARALVLEPRALLYDEPTTGLDPPTTTEITTLVNRLKTAAGITAVLTSHDMAATLRVADRIAMIRDSRVVFQGTPAEAEKDGEVQRFMRGEG